MTSLRTGVIEWLRGPRIAAACAPINLRDFTRPASILESSSSIRAQPARTALSASRLGGLRQFTARRQPAHSVVDSCGPHSRTLRCARFGPRRRLGLRSSDGERDPGLLCQPAHSVVDSCGPHSRTLRCARFGPRRRLGLRSSDGERDPGLLCQPAHSVVDSCGPHSRTLRCARFGPRRRLGLRSSDGERDPGLLCQPAHSVVDSCGPR
jgi:hypothetical protein